MDETPQCSYRDYTPDHYPLGYMLVAYGREVYGKDFGTKQPEMRQPLKVFSTRFVVHSRNRISLIHSQGHWIISKQLTENAYSSPQAVYEKANSHCSR